MARRYPGHGRIFASQFSVLTGLPLSFLLFHGLPHKGDVTASTTLYACVFFITGLMISW